MSTVRHRAAEATLALALAALSLGARRAEAQPLVEPSVGLTVDEAYDSNVFNGRGPDWVTRISPHLALQLRDERSLIKATYDMGIWDYALGKADASVNQRGALSLEERLTRRLWLKVSDELIRAEDPGYITRAAIVAPQTGILDNLGELALSARATRVLDFNLIYRYHLTKFDDQPPGAAPLYDGDEHDAIAQLAWRVTRLDDLRFSAQLQYFTIEGDPLALTVGPTLGWRHQLLRELELRLEGGPVYYQGEPAARRVDGGFSGHALEWRGSALLRFVRDPWHLSLGALRDLVGGTGAGSVLWADYLTAQAGVKVAHQLDLRAAVSYFANGFAPDQPRRYDGVAFDAGVDWRFHPLFVLGGYYSFRWQETLDAAFPQITRHIVGARLGFLYGAEATPVRREVHE